jgi:hypothetical protein
MATKATVGSNPSAWQKPQVLFRDFQKQCMGYLTNWNHRRQVPSTINHNLSKPPMMDLETLNAEWKAKKVLNEDGKPIQNLPNSPTGTESTDDNNSHLANGLRFNSVSSLEDDILGMKKH